MPGTEGDTALPYLTVTSPCLCDADPVYSWEKRKWETCGVLQSSKEVTLCDMSHCSLPPQSSSLEVGGDGNLPSRNVGEDHALP